MMPDSEVGICTLLPDVLGTYSDAGNATVLFQRLQWREVPARQIIAPIGQIPPSSCDIYLLGGGEDTAQLAAADWLGRHPALVNTLCERAFTLAVCAGMQILGRDMTTLEGDRHPGVGVLDISTEPRRRRAIGEVIAFADDLGLLLGFENHRGATRLGPTARPLGQVRRGVGNGAGLRVEGVRTDRVIGTYLHGPILARNPTLADYILAHVVGHPLAPLELPDQGALRDLYLGHRPQRGRP
jgi:hypothetical protein